MPLLLNILALMLAILTAGAYWYGFEQSLFWIYHWYDIMLHLMGGLAIGFWASAVAVRLELERLRSFLFVLCILIVGVAVWEIFEYVAGVARDFNYARDTVTDMIYGVLGGIAAWLCTIIFIRKTSTPHVE